MLRGLLLFLSEREGFKRALLRLPAARRTAERFVAGDRLDDALRAARELNARGFRVTLDYLGESVSDRAEAERAAAAYEESLEAIHASDADSTISLKLTQLGLDIDVDFCAGLLGRVVEHAERLGNFVRIDMEGSEHTEATLRVFRRVYETHRNVGVVIQSYLRRSGEDVERLARIAAPVRLCKGAYDEPEEVAFQNDDEVDRSFVRLMRVLLDAAAEAASGRVAHGNAVASDADASMRVVPGVAIATHDDAMIEATRAYVEERGIPWDAFEFQMLYGVRRDFQARLVERGYGVRIYVPYGSEWYPYLMRRMAERPANLLFVARALFGR